MLGGRRYFEGELAVPRCAEFGGAVRNVRSGQDRPVEALQVAPRDSAEGKSAAASKHSDQRAAQLDGCEHLGSGARLCVVGLYSVGRSGGERRL